MADEKEVPAAETGDKREFEFKAASWEYYENRNYSWEYRYYLFALTDPETGRVIFQETNFPDLEQALMKNPEMLDQCFDFPEVERDELLHEFDLLTSAK